MCPSVSIILVAPEPSENLERCLASITAQTLESVELLVVPCGSAEKVRRAIESATGGLGNVALVPCPTGGVAEARNLGLQAATGDFIGFVDADDTIEPDMFEELYRKASASDSDVVLCSYIDVDVRPGENVLVAQGPARLFGRPLAECPEYLELITPAVWGRLIRRNLFTFNDIVFTAGGSYSEVAVSLLLLAKANRVSKVQRGLYRRMSASAPRAAAFGRRGEELLQALSEAWQSYEREALFEQFRDELLLLSIGLILECFRHFPGQSGARAKSQFVTGSWGLLDRHRQGWRRAQIVETRFGQDWRFRLYRSRVLGRLWAVAPKAPGFFGQVAERWESLVGRLQARGSKAQRIRRAFARFMARLPVEPQVALFESFHGKSITDSPFYLLKVLASRGTHRCYVAAVDVDAARRFLERYDIDATVVERHSDEYCRLLTTAGLLVNNVTFPSWLVKRPGQVYVNTWHGTPLKTLGKAMPYGIRDVANSQRNFLKTDFLLLPNEFTRDRILRDYMVSGLFAGRAEVVGSPRNEFLFDPDRTERMRRELDVGDRRLLVYMPTWRGTSSKASKSGYADEVAEHLAIIDAALGDDDVLMVKLHQLVSEAIDVERFTHIRLAPAEYETYDFLCAADVLITDYSSVMFDFMVTKREILLFAYDLKEYLAERDLYMPIDSLPFTVFESADDLVAHLLKREVFVPGNAYQEFCDRFQHHDGPGASQGALGLVLGRGPGPAERLGRPSHADGVDIVFVPRLTSNGQRVLEEILDAGYNRSDVAIVFDGNHALGTANAYLHRLFEQRTIECDIVIASGIMVLTTAQSLADWLFRRFGWRTRIYDEACRVEEKRLLGDVVVRSAKYAGGPRRFAEITRILNGK